MKLNSAGLKKVAAIAFFSFFLWELAAYVVRSVSFPHIWQVAPELASLVNTHDFWVKLSITLWISAAGFGIGALIAIVVGIGLGLIDWLEIASRSSLNFIRVIPSVVLLPLLIASIGASTRTAIILTSMVVSLTLVTFVVRGVQDTEKQLIETAQVIGLPRFFRVLYLYLPSTISLIGSGVRICASRAFGTVIAAGIVAGTPGLGSGLYMAQINGEINRVFAYVIVMGILGTSIYSLFTRIENRLFKWRIAV